MKTALANLRSELSRYQQEKSEAVREIDEIEDMLWELEHGSIEDARRNRYYEAVLDWLESDTPEPGDSESNS